jgi:deoxyuridine 5'-triphosphate nucleotidohydrolase
LLQYIDDERAALRSVGSHGCRHLFVIKRCLALLIVEVVGAGSDGEVGFLIQNVTNAIGELALHFGLVGEHNADNGIVAGSLVGHTGAAVGIGKDFGSDDIALLIYPRSGLSTKYGIALANCVGVIDSDYRGEWFIPLINHGKSDFTVTHGMRIAQLIPTRILLPEIEVSDSLSQTNRGEGGFGSSGIENL